MIIKLESIINNDLCSGCGGCSGICPVNAITIDIQKSYKPDIDMNKCIKCNLCYQVCPGKGWEPVKQSERRCAEQKIEMDMEYGPVREFYLGKAVDNKVLQSGASGGVGTALLLYLLDEKIVEDVVVVTLDRGIPKVIVTSNIDVIKSAGGSKYIPIPLMEKVIHELHKRPRKIAITVTPCQMAALENVINIDKYIDRDLIYAIGLFCGDVKDIKSLSVIKNKLNVGSDSQFLGWRYGKWPGGAAFRMKDKSLRIESYKSFLEISQPFYTLHRCLMCPSRENWLADIALADNHKGKSNDTVIVARTNKGHELLCKANTAGVITLNKMGEKDSDNFYVSLTKFVPALQYIKYRERRKLPTPKYDYNPILYLQKTTRRLRMTKLVRYKMFIYTRNKYVLKFLTKYPVVMSRIGRFINNFPDELPGLRIYRKLIKSLIR
ncbi:Coenzyme F420 hydrogenase/dehydrogenase, beta subunit C-terminal domain [Proteiniclasticum sp. C24MP]|uniref:Coenzyme F420 hydrogenase/dehydrogenase, beta subunit C-terminal domain n=1 Tax=Proteiniclasticum sp. C24MP TaxID=3374101 RepID=UPI0037544A88